MPSLSSKRQGDTLSVWLVGASYLIPLSVFIAVYGPSVGLGFISDDFGWIVESRVQTLRGAFDLFLTNHGFYRPLVAASFAADHAMFGPNPWGYGLTNLTLLFVCAILLWRVGIALGLPRHVSSVAAALWAFNFHGINMALLWLSGRTSLCL